MVIKKLIASFFYSVEGLKAATRDEEAFRIELWCTLFALPLALYLGDGAIERILLVGSVLLILIVELMNTAVEAAINRVSTEIHPLSKKAKDTASAAVMIAVINAIIVWLLIIIG